MIWNCNDPSREKCPIFSLIQPEILFAGLLQMQYWNLNTWVILQAQIVDLKQQIAESNTSSSSSEKNIEGEDLGEAGNLNKELEASRREVESLSQQCETLRSEIQRQTQSKEDRQLTRWNSLPSKSKSTVYPWSLSPTLMQCKGPSSLNTSLSKSQNLMPS